MMENLSKITSMVKVFIHGRIRGNMMANGNRTKCTERELSFGQMAVGTLEKYEIRK